jgi:hypothetical protein
LAQVTTSVSEAETQPIRPWLVHLRRVINVVTPLALGAVMLGVAIPSDRFPEDQRARRDELINAMKQLSLSQNWGMYAPDPARSHFYLEFEAHDADGTVRPLEDGVGQEEWGTVWAWNRTRKHIWLYAMGRHIDKTSRNRTWYMRGVCVREARRGHAVRHIEVRRVFRRVRARDRVRKGDAILGPESRRKAQDSSCNVAIIRKMIEADQQRIAGDD